MEALGVNLGFFVVQLFNFLIVMIVLYAWAYKPILKALETRKQKVAQGLEDARIAAEARANAEKEAQKVLAAAQTQAAQKVAEATTRAEQAAKDILARAEQDAAARRAKAEEEAEVERNRILGDLRGQMAALVIAASQQVVGEIVKKERAYADSLVEEFFSGVRGGKVQVLEGAEVSGQAAEVTSALPLNEEQQRAVKQDVIAKLGGAASVSFRVDPSILGGLRVRVGGKVLDGSVAGRIAGLRQAIG